MTDKDIKEMHVPLRRGLAGGKSHHVGHSHDSIYGVNDFYVRKLLPHARMSKGEHSMPPACAAVNCFFYLQEGHVDVNVCGNNIKVHGGELLIIPKGREFSIAGCSDVLGGYMGGFSHEFVLLDSQGNSLDGFLNTWAISPVELSGKKREYVDSIFSRIYDEWTEENRDLSIVRYYFSIIFLEIKRSESGILAGVDSASSRIVGAFLSCLSASGVEKLKVEDYASKLGISPGHLSKCVKKVTEKSPQKWIEERLITEAKKMLYQSEYSISEIADRVGVDDASYFSRLFKKMEGITPVEFRRMIKKS